ncbi:MAG: ubiquinol oxidase subunit II [Methylobacterium sp.]|uniref:ubiquinol oxidase subunit II n=1 Tax=Methylobacterium sp. TaxID=409 RepID=UPI0025DF5039|nr:ubiquinol oxidase subunit II [Methylobacterium sp.]MBX9930021.1 ubiquinol oxidase subunit II [Methylobacterium sp.]
MPSRLSRAIILAPLAVVFGGLLSGCNVVSMNPSGDVAVQQRDLILASTGLMLLIIVPVIALTLLFAWRYRHTNTEATYDPDWHHSTQLEVVIWAAPLAIVIALGALTWISTHLLDPYRPLGRLDRNRPIPADVKPITVEVVALDWKWLFFYPDQGIATVNELAAPVDVPINFKLTSASVMNTFFIPALAGQIYTMAGMETKLHAVINKPGVFNGFSGNYSGSGFSKMNFKFHGLADRSEFDRWVGKIKSEGKPLGREEYIALEKPSEAEPVRYFGTVDPGLYKAILNMCAYPGKMCMSEMMNIDARGGAGKNSQANRTRLEYDNRHGQQGDEAPGATFPASGRESRSDEKPEGVKSGGSREEPSKADPHKGHGHHDHGGSAPAQLNN